MTPNDRFALELGRAIVRALIAEARAAQLEQDLEALKSEHAKEDEKAEGASTWQPA